jgi:hypothetical protein
VICLHIGFLCLNQADSYGKGKWSACDVARTRDLALLVNMLSHIYNSLANICNCLSVVDNNYKQII